MKNISSILLLVMITVFLITGCGQNSVNKTETSAPSISPTSTPIPTPDEKKADKTQEVIPSTDRYKDGTYSWLGGGKESGMKVTVKVKDGKISQVTVDSHNETKGYTDEAIEEISKKIVTKNSWDVDVISRVTETSQGIKYAVKNALKDAKIVVPGT